MTRVNFRKLLIINTLRVGKPILYPTELRPPALKALFSICSFTESQRIRFDLAADSVAQLAFQAL